MDEHDLMEVLRAFVQSATNTAREFGCAELFDAEVFATAGDSASFGVQLPDGARFIVNVTQITEGQ
jgi:hypothetical protein